jgi:hypothetical protein
MTDSTVFTDQGARLGQQLAAASTAEAAETGAVVARWKLDFDLP